jgi:hypothetical protein
MGHSNDANEPVLDFYLEGDVDDPRPDSQKGSNFSEMGVGDTPEEGWRDALERQR